MTVGTVGGRSWLVPSPVVLIETRDVTLNRTGQIPDRDISNFVAVVRWRNPGAWSLTLPNDSPAADTLRTPGAGVVVTLDGDPLVSGPVVTVTRTVKPSERVDDWTFEGVTDDIHLSDRRSWPSPTSADVTAQPGTSGSGKDRRTGVTETLMRAYVNANIGPAAPAARRVTGLVLGAEHSPPLGPTVTGTARFETLRESLTSLGTPAGLGFSVTQVGSQLVFDVLQPRDLRATVQFDPDNDTADEVTYSYGAPALTRAIVAGPGEMAAREHLERTSADSLDAEAAWGRRIEQYLDRRDVAADDVDKTAQLQRAGDEALAEGGSTVTGLQLTPADTLAVRFRRDWYVGDTVAVFIPGVVDGGDRVELAGTIAEAHLAYGPEGFKARAVLGDPDAVARKPLLRAIREQRDQARRLSRLERR